MSNTMTVTTPGFSPMRQENKKHEREREAVLSESFVLQDTSQPVGIECTFPTRIQHATKKKTHGSKEVLSYKSLYKFCAKKK